MSYEMQIILMGPGEGFRDALVRAYDFPDMWVDDDDPDDEAGNYQEVVDVPKGSFSGSRDTTMKAIADLWDGWEPPSDDFWGDFIGDHFAWVISVDDSGVDFLWIKGSDEDDPRCPITIYDVAELFVGRGAIFGSGDEFAWCEIDDPWMFNRQPGLSDFSEGPISLYDAILAQHGSSDIPKERDLVARTLHYKALVLCDDELHEDEVATLRDLINRFRGDTEPLMRGRVLIAMAHIVDYLNDFGTEEELAVAVADISDYRTDADTKTLKALATSSSAHLAKFFEL